MKLISLIFSIIYFFVQNDLNAWDKQVYFCLTRICLGNTVLGSGFFIDGEEKYDNTIFLVTARHVIGDGRGLSACYLQGFAQEEKIPFKEYERCTLRTIDNDWYFHPNDYLHSDEIMKTYDIAVFVIGKQEILNANGKNNAVKISLLQDYQTIPSSEALRAIGFSDAQFDFDKLHDWIPRNVYNTRLVGRKKDEPFLFDRPLLNLQISTNWITLEALQVTSGGINRGDSGGIIYLSPHVNGAIERDVKYGINDPLYKAFRVFGMMVAIVPKEDDEIWGKPIRRNDGVFMVTSKRIKEAIDYAFSKWKVSELK